jgi:penicillin-binding protein 1B
VNSAGFSHRAAAAINWLRPRLTRRRVFIALGVSASAGIIAVLGEAIARAHLQPPLARVPSALYTRPVAWGNGDNPGAVQVGPIDIDIQEWREPVELRYLPRHLIEAVLAVEDQRFRIHAGLDARRIAGAFVANLKAGGVAEGGSTITQQLAKNLFLSARRTPLRKIREAAHAAMLEFRYSKDRILEAYLNEIYLGQDGGTAIHGVGAASRYYFGKPADSISIAEAAMLAGMIQAPSRLAPTRREASAIERRNLVLDLMVKQKRIDEAVAAPARKSEVSTRGHPRTLIDGRYFRDYVAASTHDSIPGRGISIFTTLDAALQHHAERAVTRGLARLRRPGLQAALVALDPATGDVLAMVGGADYGESQFNRAAEALRQPGSAFKPIVALAALEGSSRHEPYTLASMLEDEPLAVRTTNGVWQPVDYDGTYRGIVTLRHALEQSLNIPFARIGLAIGPDRIVSSARQLGITTELHAVPSLALGSSEVTLLELTRAYGVFATQGTLANTRSILAQRGPDGAMHDAAAPGGTRVADPAVTFLVTSALQGAVQRGTGAGLRPSRFAADIAGKTGTSNDWRDAWFIAYAPSIVVGAWVGYDDSRSVRLAGGDAALPIVAEFLAASRAARGRFRIPPGIETSYVVMNEWNWCGESEFFLRGTAPPSYDCAFVGNGEGFLDTLKAIPGQIKRFLIGR